MCVLYPGSKTGKFFKMQDKCPLELGAISILLNTASPVTKKKCGFNKYLLNKLIFIEKAHQF